MNKNRFETRIVMTEFGRRAVKRPRRKKSKFKKLDDNNMFEAEMIKRRKKKILEKLRALG